LGELQLTFKEMYSLTPRSFFNALNGAQKKEDALSKERWVMTREIMFAVMKPYLDNGTEKTDVLSFEWEKEQLKIIAETKIKTIKAGKKRMDAFWKKQDAVLNPKK
jgi:hypothetical protein